MDELERLRNVIGREESRADSEQQRAEKAERERDGLAAKNAAQRTASEDAAKDALVIYRALSERYGNSSPVLWHETARRDYQRAWARLRELAQAASA